MTKAPLEFAAKRRMQMAPTSWEAECSAHVAWAEMLVEMMHPAVTTEDWSLMDCQEYFVDLEMSLTGAATALEVSVPGQLRDEQVGTYRELEQKVGVARGLANKLRARHLEAYDSARRTGCVCRHVGNLEETDDGEGAAGREVGRLPSPGPC
jgi:hypothetical protein